MSIRHHGTKDWINLFQDDTQSLTRSERLAQSNSVYGIQQCFGCARLEKLGSHLLDHQYPRGDWSTSFVLLHQDFAELDECASLGCKPCRGYRKAVILSQTRDHKDLQRLRETSVPVHASAEFEASRLTVDPYRLALKYGSQQQECVRMTGSGRPSIESTIDIRTVH